LSNKRAITLVEVTVVLAIAGMALAAVFYIFINSKRADSSGEKAEEYYRLYSMLEMKLKKDIRNSTAISRPSSDEYALSVICNGSDGTPSIKEVRYRTGKSGKLVERIFEGKAEKYDFTKLVEGQDFIFKIAW